MIINTEYNRDNALAYAKRWALLRNPAYLNFDSLGGDCTNFISQCLYAGCKTMNYTPVTGWYYSSPDNRSAAWTGVEYFYKFLINNGKNPSGIGPYAKESDKSTILPGDIIQLGNGDGHFYHTLIVMGKDISGDFLISSHTFDSYMRPLSTYFFEKIRYLHIVGCRKQV